MMTFRIMFFCIMFLWGGAIWPDSVRLISTSGKTELHGKILDYNGSLYQLLTKAGEVTVRAADFLCDGKNCPAVDHHIGHAVISGAPVLARRLLPPLIHAFAKNEGLEVSKKQTSISEQLYTFSSENGDAVLARLWVRSTSSTQGFRDIVAGRADMALSTRQIRPEEQEIANKRWLGEFSRAGLVRVLAQDAIVPVVSPYNPIEALSLDQLTGILQGHIRNWSELGGVDLPIVVHMLSPYSNTAAGVIEKLGPEQTKKRLKGNIFSRAEASLIASVRVNPQALGLVSWSAGKDVKILPLIDKCGQIFQATPDTIKSGSYPLTAPMFLYVPERQQPGLIRKLLRFIRSPKVQPIIAETGFVDQSPTQIKSSDEHMQPVQRVNVSDGDAKAEGGLFKRMDRLGMTFRFREGRTILDPVSQSNVQLLATALADGEYTGKELIFIGFSDSEGDFSTNIKIAGNRAKLVQKSVLAALDLPTPAPTRLTALAVGEVLPVACNDEDWGRALNRRVELWVRSD